MLTTLAQKAGASHGSTAQTKRLSEDEQQSSSSLCGTHTSLKSKWEDSKRAADVHIFMLRLLGMTKALALQRASRTVWQDAHACAQRGKQTKGAASIFSRTQEPNVQEDKMKPFAI
jgi:hypothetical protein